MVTTTKNGDKKTKIQKKFPIFVWLIENKQNDLSTNYRKRDKDNDGDIDKDDMRVVLDLKKNEMLA